MTNYTTSQFIWNTFFLLKLNQSLLFKIIPYNKYYEEPSNQDCSPNYKAGDGMECLEHKNGLFFVMKPVQILVKLQSSLNHLLKFHTNTFHRLQQLPSSNEPCLVLFTYRLCIVLSLVFKICNNFVVFCLVNWCLVFIKSISYQLLLRVRN